jgi:DNA-binding CsgD family transcriptional regulator
MHTSPHVRLGWLLDAVGDIYASALDPDRMSDALLALTKGLASRATQMYTYDRATGVIVESSIDEALSAQGNREYVEQWALSDPAPVELAKLESGSVLRCHELFDERYVSRSAFYQDFFIPYGFRWRLGGIVHGSDGTSTVVASLRSTEQPAFDGGSARLLSMVLPHVRRASALRAKFQARAAAQSGLAAIVAHLPSPCALVDLRGRLALANPAAHAAFFELQLQLAGVHLRFVHAATQAKWLGILDLASRSLSSRSLSVRDEGGQRWNITAIAWRTLVPSCDPTEATLLLVTFERERRVPLSQVGTLTLGAHLSVAERETLELLTSGCSAKQIAQQRGVALNTVRNQIRSILEKTGSHSQRQLLTLLASAA